MKKLQVSGVWPKWWDNANQALSLKDALVTCPYNTNYAFEKKYNCKLVYGSTGFINYVVFPNEEEATMFVLRWS